MTQQKPCEHCFVLYYSTKTKQCVDCKIVLPMLVNCGMTEHKRHSNCGDHR